MTNESNEVAALLEIINSKKAIAEKATSEAIEKKKQLDIDSVEINRK